MKKNLIALAVLVVLVAVAAQFTRQGGKKPEWVALERDMEACLQVFWQQSGQKAELIPGAGGPMALVTVRMPPQAKARWNYPFLKFVVARHPAVQLQGMEVRDGLNGNPIAAEDARSAENSLSLRGPDSGEPGRRAELLGRQGQAVVDEQLGAGQGLFLVDVQEVASPVSAAPVNPEPAFERAAPEPQGKSAPSARRRVEAAEGMRHDQATSPPPPQYQVRFCLVVGTLPPRETLSRIHVKLRSGSHDDFRMQTVTLPPR